MFNMLVFLYYFTSEIFYLLFFFVSFFGRHGVDFESVARVTWLQDHHPDGSAQPRPQSKDDFEVWASTGLDRLNWILQLTFQATLPFLMEVTDAPPRPSTCRQSSGLESSSSGNWTSRRADNLHVFMHFCCFACLIHGRGAVDVFRVGLHRSTEHWSPRHPWNRAWIVDAGLLLDHVSTGPFGYWTASGLVLAPRRAARSVPAASGGGAWRVGHSAPPGPGWVQAGGGRGAHERGYIQKQTFQGRWIAGHQMDSLIGEIVCTTL